MRVKLRGKPSMSFCCRTYSATVTKHKTHDIFMNPKQNKKNNNVFFALQNHVIRLEPINIRLFVSPRVIRDITFFPRNMAAFPFPAGLFNFSFTAGGFNFSHNFSLNLVHVLASGLLFKYKL